LDENQVTCKPATMQTTNNYEGANI